MYLSSRIISINTHILGNVVSRRGSQNDQGSGRARELLFFSRFPAAIDVPEG